MAVMSGVRIGTSIVRVQPVYLDEGEPGLKDQAETGVMGPVGEDVSEQCVQPRPWKWKSDGHSLLGRKFGAPKTPRATQPPLPQKGTVEKDLSQTQHIFPECRF